MPLIVPLEAKFTKPPLGSKIDASHNLARGLIGAWDNLERRSSRAINSAPGYQKWNGVAGGTISQNPNSDQKWTPWTFNGTWYYDISGPSVQNYSMGTKSFAINARFKLTNSGYLQLLCAQDLSTANGWTLQQDSSSKIIFLISTTAGAASIVSTPLSYNDGLWHDAFCVRNAPAGTLSIYIDGRLAVTGTDGGRDVGISTTNVYIGAGRFGSAAFLWPGSVAYARVWKGRHFTPSEVSQLYRNPYIFYKSSLDVITQYGPPPGIPSVDINGDVLLNGVQVDGILIEKYILSGESTLGAVEVSGELLSRLILTGDVVVAGIEVNGRIVVPDVSVTGDVVLVGMTAQGDLVKSLARLNLNGRYAPSVSLEAGYLADIPLLGKYSPNINLQGRD